MAFSSEVYLLLTPFFYCMVDANSQMVQSVNVSGQFPVLFERSVGSVPFRCMPVLDQYMYCSLHWPGLHNEKRVH